MTGTFDDGLLYSNRRTPDQDAAAIRYVLAQGLRTASTRSSGEVMTSERG